jgi:O-phospho-L-seryl-tRNASec:L-selenocysteinyl-tRNA synthase
VIDVFHIVNNAYGIQSRQSNSMIVTMYFLQHTSIYFYVHFVDWIELASRKGRVDMIVQSTDKNFMVPVGGAVLASSKVDYVKNVAQM